MSFQHGWGADEEGGGVVVDSAFIFRFRFMSFMVDEFQSSSGFDKRKCTYCEQQTHIQRVVDGTSFFLPPPFLSFFLFIQLIKMWLPNILQSSFSVAISLLLLRGRPKNDELGGAAFH